MTECVSRSFSFRHPSGSSNFFHTITWSPGALTLFGDAGELVLRHWQALQNFESGMAWVEAADVHYLLEKSDKQTALDIPATLSYLAEVANREPLEAMWGRVDRRHRRDPTTGEMVVDTRRITGAMHEMRAYRRLPEDERDCLPEVLQPFEDRAKFGSDRRYHDNDGWSIDDAWSQWFKLWSALTKEGHLWSDDPNMIRTAKGRREIKGVLATLADDNQHEFVSFLAGLEWDYYGSYDYKGSDRFKVEIIKIAASKIVALMNRERADVA